MCAMAFDERGLDSYIDVAQRIADFREKYPEGHVAPMLQPGGEYYRLVQAQGFEKDATLVMQTFVVVVAGAYRTPTDPSPGVGMAWEIFPGRTPYTRGSELQNAETSAWGRAIIAVGASDSKRGIASREEVRNRQAERDDGLPVNKDGSLSRSRTTDEEKAAAGVPTDAQQKELNAQAKAPPNSQPVERLDAPVDDLWNTDAPSWAVGADPPEDQPGSILPAQRSQIMAVYTALGIKDRDKRLKDIAEVLWPGSLFAAESFASTNDLSHKQAAALLENLHERHSGKMTRR
jgi:hypothetical protein